MQRLYLVLRQQLRNCINVQRQSLPLCQPVSRLSTGPKNPRTEVESLTAGEKLIKSKLQEAFPEATHIQVADVSGGCGAMYQIAIESPDFKDVPKILQHRMVNKALAEEIKSMHGLQLTTKAPDTEKR